MKQLFILTLLLFVFSLSANGQPESETTDNEWTTYQTDEFSIEYPNDWSLDNSGIIGSSFFLFSPLTTVLDDFKDNISLIKEDISAYNIDLDGYVEAAEKQIKTLITDSKIISSERKMTNNLAFHELIYYSKQGEYKLNIKQQYWLIDNMAYIITFSYKTDVEEEIKTIANQIINTLKLNADFEQVIEENDGEEIISKTSKSYLSENFSIEYPNDWELDKSGKLGMKFIILSPLTSENDDFRENVNLITEDISDYEIDLEQYIDLSFDRLKNVITDGQIIFNKEKSRDGLTYHQVISQGKVGTLDLKFNQYLWLIDGNAYVLTFTADVDTFDEYQAISETIMNSFKIQ